MKHSDLPTNKDVSHVHAETRRREQTNDEIELEEDTSLKRRHLTVEGSSMYGYEGHYLDGLYSESERGGRGF